MKPDLARLYRRFTRNRRAGAQPPDVDALVALAEGDRSEQTERLLGDAGRSALHADLVRFARALRPESARLGVQLERAFEATPPQHRGAAQHARGASVPRRLQRVATALAACFVAAIVVWSYQQNRHAPPEPVAAQGSQPDRIFASLGDSRSAPVREDAIFRGGFSGDKIFKSEFNGG